MPTNTRRMLGATALGVLIAASAMVAEAQQMAPAGAPAAAPPPPVRIRGTLEKVDGSALTIKSRTGETVQVKLADNARITAMVKATIADIKKGDFIGVTAMPQPDGSQKAIGLHIFMEAQKAVVPHRFSPWDREPGSTMTNADVDSTVAGVEGQTIVVKYPDGEKNIVVGPDVPIVRYEVMDTGALKPGIAFSVLAAAKQPDGSYNISRINIGRDGVVPR